MKEESKNRIKKDKRNKERKNKVKRKISIFTIMLWIFLACTMITITVNSTKKTNALEVIDENWNIGLVMYDRSSDTPNEKITEFTWNEVNEFEIKQLCMQINYACTTGKEYQPGEIEITIPGIPKDSFSESNINSDWLKKNVTIAADNEDENMGYDFSYRYDEQSNIYAFINNEVIAKNEHFEGSIQIIYKLEPIFRIKTDLEFKAKIKENIENSKEIIAMESNICNFHYTSTKKEYTLIKNAIVAPNGIDYTKIEDILDDYYWVEYNFTYNINDGVIEAYGGNSNRLIKKNDEKKVYCIKENLAEGCVLYDGILDLISPKNGNTYYYLAVNGDHRIYSYYVGYPKDRYNKGDKITNTAELWGRYEDEDEIQKLAEASTEVNLADFNFDYTGELYRVNKKCNVYGAYNSEILQGDYENDWTISPFAFYSGNVMDLEIGDDLLYITRENGDVTKLNDDEYNFTKINIPIFYTSNKYIQGKGEMLIGYEYEVQVRYKDTNEYVVIYNGVTKDESEDIIFERDDIAGVKVVIKNLDKTLYQGSFQLNTSIHPSEFNIGKLYNFCYLQSYIRDADDNRILHNEVNLGNYTTDMTKLKIAEYDINVYGRYMQRAVSSINIVDGYFNLKNSKRFRNLQNNVKKEKYELNYTFTAILDAQDYDINKDVIIKQYDILPSGINLVSSKDEIINNIVSVLGNQNLKLKDGTKLESKYDFECYIKENTTVDIDYNYKNSGRTKISIIYNLNEIDWSLISYIYGDIMTFIRVEIPYDSIQEHGTSYENYIYTMWGNQEYGYSRSGGLDLDNGIKDLLAKDIDEDGDTTEKVSCASSILNITHAVSSKQSVIKQVKTDMTNGKFVSDMAEAQAGSEYTYRLKVTTGANSLKDLIIYDNLETILYSEENDISSGWKGEFVGVDTTYAKLKGYAPVVYYSEEINPGKLTEVPEKWMELTDGVDKTTVKSICVDLRYKENGSEMELGSNDLVYVLVNMKAPEDTTITTSANNMFSTNWRAKDPIGTVIDNVEGIYSNEVSVKIFKEEDRKKDIVGSKFWTDNYDENRRRPKNITVKLLQDGIEYMRQEVIAVEDWKYVFKDVPVYKNSNLEKYEYRVEEEKVPYYEATYDGYDIINTLSGKDISGEKTWNDEWNRYSTRPESIIIKLLQDGIEYRRCEVTRDNNWKYKFEDVPIYKNDNLEEYEYRVEEVKVPGYDAKYNGYNITNTLKTKTIEVTKIWEDNENEYGLRPKFVKILIYDGENKISEGYVREDTDWKYEFTGLPEFREDGSKIEYRIDEEVEKRIEEYWGGGYWEIEENFENEGDFELYNKYYVKEIVENTVTNKYIDPDERIKITGKKVWEDSDNKALKRPDSVVLQIKNGDKVVNEAVVTEETGWNFEFEVPKYDKDGNEIEYHIDEREIPKFYEKEIVDDFTVKNKFKVPDEKTKIEVIKLWEDLDNKYSKRPKSVTLQVLSKDKVVSEQVVNEKSNFRHEFELPKYDEFGNEIEYRADEKEEVENYEKRISGYTVINKCIYEPVTDTSDINILLYIIIFGVSVIGIIAVVLIARKKKINNR